MAPDASDGMDAVTEELYALEPGDFVTARNELVKRLKKAGDKQLAAEVGKLRRPTPAAWAVNQLARLHRAELEDLVTKGEELRAAQDGALGGAQSGDLRQAGRARRDAVARLVELAEGILGERGAAYSGEVAATLEAASLDAEAAEAVLGGRLSAELQPPSGFGAFDMTVAERPAAPKAVKAPKEDTAPEPDRRRLEEAREAADEARRRWEELSEKARAAVEKVDERRKAVRQLEAEVARLEDALADAERKLRAAVRETEHAEDAASRAEDAASRSRERVRAADQRLAELGGA
jgi:hypothetical protein